MSADEKILLSRPTFAELTKALADAGRQQLFNEHGEIECGSIVFATADGVSQASRIAAAFDAAASRPDCLHGAAAYEDDSVAIFTKAKPSGIQIIETRPGIDHQVVTLPRDAVPAVAGEIIDLLAPPTHS